MPISNSAHHAARSPLPSKMEVMFAYQKCQPITCLINEHALAPRPVGFLAQKRDCLDWMQNRTSSKMVMPLNPTALSMSKYTATSNNVATITSAWKPVHFSIFSPSKRVCTFFPIHNAPRQSELHCWAYLWSAGNAAATNRLLELAWQAPADS